MSEIIKALGIGLILLSAFLFSSEYEKKIKHSERLSEGFLSLTEHIRRQINCYLTPPSELIRNFSNDALFEIGFIDLAEKEGLGAAYKSLKDDMPLCEAVKKELTSLFKSLEREYKDGAVRALDSAAASLKECLAKEREENKKDLKVARTLVTAAALGVVILII
ncbi:MAG: hypothetical protein J6B48_08075 [Clostridia bacterium]|nr:hypothetical protein [Clostridia bacterium]